MKPKWKWLPPWNMPSDPVKAVFWFLHWSLQVLVRYFYVPTIVGAAYETYLNSFTGLFFTLLVGLAVWALLASLLVVVNFMARVSQTFSEVSHLSQQSFSSFKTFVPPGSFYSTPEKEAENVVEGSIITDLGEERKKRRQEM